MKNTGIDSPGRRRLLMTAVTLPLAVTLGRAEGAPAAPPATPGPAHPGAAADALPVALCTGMPSDATLFLSGLCNVPCR